MSIIDLFGHREHSQNLSHFAAIVSMAAVDGKINPGEEAQLKKFSSKLGVSEEEYEVVLNNALAFPIDSYNSEEKRLERLHDLFKIIFADHEIDADEINLLKKYAVGLGFSSQTSERIIKKSIRIFNGEIDFEDYVYLIRKSGNIKD
ncbi:MAG TPA: TerB family tellurite resistance protein [Salinimicrobium sp.]|nr:TerB family tellurite resistance protein [Salinimicrobium sp.]